MKKLLFAAVAAFSLAGAAHASVIPVLQTVTDEAGLFRFTYQASLATDAGLTAGSQFVIFDFSGFAGGLVSSDPRFTATTQNTTAGYGLPPGFSDDALIPNLVFTWNNGDFRTSGGPYAQPTNFTVSALSEFGGMRMDAYGAFTVINNGPAQGSLALNSGSTAVPLAIAVPEPASWALMIVGFGGVGALMRRRRETHAAA